MARQLQTQTLVHYRTVQIIKSACLGIGSYGAVYKAICDELPCAAKILHPTLFETNDPGSQKIIDRFDQECDFLSGVRHPHIVQYLGVSRDPESGLPVLLMELLDGNLTHFLEQSQEPLPYHIQVSLCYDISLALAYLHSNGTIHRDLSSNNILLVAGGRVKVTDFGMSKFTDTKSHMTPLTMCPGTNVYMSPEALKEPPVYTEKLDCFSHGVLAIQIITRQFPNPGKRTQTVPSPQSPTGWIEIPVLDIKRRKSHIDLIDPTHPLLTIATNCLSYNEEDRSSAQELCHLLAALKQAPRYVESVQQTQERSTPAQRTDSEERERRIRELQQQQEEQVLEIQSLRLQIQAAENQDQELKVPPIHSKKKDPRRRPTAAKLLKISSVKSQSKIDRQISEANMHGFNIPAPMRAEPTKEPMPAWLQTAASDPHYKPRIQRISSVPMVEDSEYHDPDQQADTPTSPAGRQLPPPVPPSHKNAPPPPPPKPKYSQKSPRHPDEASSPVYGNVDQPPVPPHRSCTPREPNVPPIPPRMRHADNGQQSRGKNHSQSSPTERRAYFAKIFNGCPLHLNCASSWHHPITKLQYIVLGAEEGLFSLLVTDNPDNPDSVMEQVSSRPCYWVKVVKNTLIWLSGHSRFVSMTNLVPLFQSESQKASLQHRNRSHTAKIPDSKGCYKCCISRNPFTDKTYLIAAVPKGILLMQWYQPKNAFMHVMLFECQVPQPVHMITAFTQEDIEYPIVCFGVKESLGGTLSFNTLNLNSQASWFTDKPEGKDLPVLCVQQLEKNTIFIGLERCAKFVDHTGTLKPSSVRVSQLTFEKKSDRMVFLSNCVLSFHKHGMQGKSLVTQQVTAEIADGSKTFHLLGSHGTIVIETRPSDDPTAPSNIYILVSEDSEQS